MFRLDAAALRMQQDRARKFGAFDRQVFEEQNAAVVGGASEAGDDLAGVNVATGYFFGGDQSAGIVPADRRIFKRLGAAELVNAGKFEASVDFEFVQNFLV